MRVLASDRKLTELTYHDGPVQARQKDGTFHVDDALGKSMVKSSEFAQVGINFQSARGHVCPACGRENVFKDSCGGCGWHGSSG